MRQSSPKPRAFVESHVIRLINWMDLKRELSSAAHIAFGLAGLLMLGSLVAGAPGDPQSGSFHQRDGVMTTHAGDLHEMRTPFRRSPATGVVVGTDVRTDQTQGILPAILPVRSGVYDSAVQLKKENKCLATGIYFEARGESWFGQRAVAEVILNRVASPDYPDTICGVVFEGAWRSTGCQFSFACDGISDRPRDRVAYKKAERVAKYAAMGFGQVPVLGRHVTHYHADYVNPYWAQQLHKVRKIGSHIFYARRRSAS